MKTLCRAGILLIMVHGYALADSSVKADAARVGKGLGGGQADR